MRSRIGVVVFLGSTALLIGCAGMEESRSSGSSIESGSTATSQASEDVMGEFSENNLLDNEKKLMSTEGGGGGQAGAKYRALSAAFMDKADLGDLESTGEGGEYATDEAHDVEAEKLECNLCQELIRSRSKFEEKHISHAQWIMAFYADDYVKPLFGTSFLKFSEASRDHAMNAVAIEVACFAETSFLANYIEELSQKKQQLEGAQYALEATKKNLADIKKAYNTFYANNNKIMETAGKLATLLVKKSVLVKDAEATMSISDAFKLPKGWSSCATGEKANAARRQQDVEESG